METTRTTYSVDVTPSFDGLAPQYEVSIYRTIRGGICGPTGDETTVSSLSSVDAWLTGRGFSRTSNFGPVCTNGFASAPLAVIR